MNKNKDRDDNMIKKVLFPLLFLVLAYFVLSYESAKEIIAGIAIFLVGMYFMEDGFKLFSGGVLEKILERFTNTLPKGILNGFLITSVVQSSSLTSVILISFLGASLIALESAIYVLLGSSLGSSTTAWIIALFGLKIKISHYAMPIIAFGIFFRFSKNQKQKGFGNILLGLGFIFLGISYMVVGFEELKESVDLSVYSLDGFLGLFIFFIIGAFMTFIVQSSSASTAIILVALSSGQLLYFNAIAAVIGGKIGSTTTTILGSLNSNSNGKRLAFSQFILNLIATLFGIIFFYPIIYFIDFISNYFSIESDVIKLTIFVTIFNLSAVLIVIPLLPKIVERLKKMFIPKVKSWSKLEFLDSESLESSKSIVVGLKKENIILYNKLIKAIKHQLLINDEDIYWNKKHKDKKSPQNSKIDKIYKEKIKKLHDEILDFISFANKNINENDLKTFDSQKLLTKDMYKILKKIKTFHKNINVGVDSRNPNISKEYIFIKELFMICIKELENISQNMTIDDIDKIYKTKTLQQKLNSLDSLSTKRVDELFAQKRLDSIETTKIIRDVSFAILLCQSLINITTTIFIEDSLLLDEDEEDEN
ncbi:Na/Pi cotransporter family protein [Aliarcobacter lanthieri]|uniref:Na/Pi cotransporter family protein n=2 Tax=Aliarcobacter lanthieri TaxID=1355374 RepID=UPI00068C8F04|nr:Na/Pi symporter [Aliarcobacter lanthieri]QKF58640.1 sodium:phosphate symporter [Aliarcobacter lanthieri]